MPQNASKKTGNTKKTGGGGSRKARAMAARLAAAQVVYQQLGNPDVRSKDVIAAGKDFLDHYAGMDIDGETMVKPDTELFSGIIRGVIARQFDLEEAILESLRRARGDKAHKPELLLHAILLCGTYELYAHNEIDAPIIISDYVHVAKAFYDGREPALVNALLDALKAEFREDAKKE